MPLPPGGPVNCAGGGQVCVAATPAAPCSRARAAFFSANPSSASWSPDTLPLEADRAGGPLEDGAGLAAVRRLRAPIHEERDTRRLYADAGHVGVTLLADEPRPAHGWQGEDVPATGPIEARDAAARRGGGGRQTFTRSARGARAPARASGSGTAGRGDWRTRTGRAARRADLVRRRTHAATDSVGILTARSNARGGRAGTTAHCTRRVNAHATVLAHPVDAAVRRAGVPVVAVRIGLAGRRGQRGRRAGASWWSRRAALDRSSPGRSRA